MSRAGKAAADVVIVAYLVFCVIDAPPVVSPVQAGAKAALDPVLDVTGLWQESWRLFAPEPKKINRAVSARFVLDDGVTLEWRSPDWRRLNLFEKFFSVRRMKYYDQLAMDANRAAWRTFALYRIAQIPTPARDRVVRVELWRHWRTTLPPDQRWIPAAAAEDLDESNLFFTLERQ